MKRRTESVILMAIVCGVIVSFSLVLNDSDRFFSDYLYDEIAAWEQKEVHAKENNPKENRTEEDTAESEEAVSTKEPEQSIPETEESREGPSDMKYNKSDSNVSNDSKNDKEADNKEETLGYPVTTEKPGMSNVYQTEIPYHENEPVHTEEATHTPIVTPSPTPEPDLPKPTPTSTPELLSISAEWPDKDTIVYKSNIQTTTLAVTGRMSDGEIISISTNKCSIIGLESKSLGEHTMIIKYGGLKTTLLYTVILGEEFNLGYEWDVDKNIGKIIKGENPEDFLYVYKEFNDGDWEYVENYSVTGIDFEKLGKQTGTISCEGKTILFTCEIVEKQYIKTVRYCNKSGELINEKKDIINVALTDNVRLTEPDSNTTYETEEYTLQAIEFKVDGEEKSFPYTIKKRDVLTELICVYVKNE